MEFFAVFSASTNGLLWLDQAPSVDEAVRSLNRKTPFADVEPSDHEEFISVVCVSPAEAAALNALEWGDQIPELANDFTEFSYSGALAVVSG